MLNRKLRVEFAWANHNLKIEDWSGLIAHPIFTLAATVRLLLV